MRRGFVEKKLDVPILLCPELCYRTRDRFVTTGFKIPSPTSLLPMGLFFGRWQPLPGELRTAGAFFICPSSIVTSAETIPAAALVARSGIQGDAF
jgi:hypothetical protein